MGKMRKINGVYHELTEKKIQMGRWKCRGIQQILEI